MKTCVLFFQKPLYISGLCHNTFIVWRSHVGSNQQWKLPARLSQARAPDLIDHQILQTTFRTNVWQSTSRTDILSLGTYRLFDRAGEHLVVGCHIYYSAKNALETQNDLRLQNTAGHAVTSVDHRAPLEKIQMRISVFFYSKLLDLFKRAMPQFLQLKKRLAYIFQVCRLKSVLIFSILSYPCSFMVYYDLFGVFLSQ